MSRLQQGPEAPVQPRPFMKLVEVKPVEEDEESEEEDQKRVPPWKGKDDLYSNPDVFKEQDNRAIQVRYVQCSDIFL